LFIRLRSIYRIEQEAPRRLPFLYCLIIRDTR
jgi:hypothetical protein